MPAPSGSRPPHHEKSANLSVDRAIDGAQTNLLTAGPSISADEQPRFLPPVTSFSAAAPLGRRARHVGNESDGGLGPAGAIDGDVGQFEEWRYITFSWMSCWAWWRSLSRLARSISIARRRLQPAPPAQ